MNTCTIGEDGLSNGVDLQVVVAVRHCCMPEVDTKPEVVILGRKTSG